MKPIKVLPLIEAIHLIEELEKDPLNLTISTRLRVETLRRDRINLVDENDTRRVLRRVSV